MTKSYDLIFSLGANCSSAGNLARNETQKQRDNLMTKVQHGRGFEEN